MLLKRRCADIYGILPKEFRRYMDGVFNQLLPDERIGIMSEPRRLIIKLNTHWHVFLASKPKKSDAYSSAAPQGDSRTPKRPRATADGGGRSGRVTGPKGGHDKKKSAKSSKPQFPRLTPVAYKAIQGQLTKQGNSTEICTKCGDLGEHTTSNCDGQAKESYSALKARFGEQLKDNFEMPSSIFVDKSK